MAIGSLLKIFPRIKRCCFCTRKLGFACGLIAVWSMFVSVHEIRFLIVPACEDQYDACDDGLDVILLTLKLILIPINVFAWICSFFFLVTVYMMAWVFIIVLYVFSGVMVSILSMLFAVTLYIHLSCTRCNFELNDVVFLVMYSILWMYYMFIVSTYGLTIDREYRDDKKGSFIPKMYKQNSEIAAKYAGVPYNSDDKSISVSKSDKDLSAKSKLRKKFKVQFYTKVKNSTASNSDANSNTAKAKNKKPTKPNIDLKANETKKQTKKKQEKKSKTGKFASKDDGSDSEEVATMTKGKKKIQKGNASPKLDIKPSVTKKAETKKSLKKIKRTKVSTPGIKS